MIYVAVNEKRKVGRKGGEEGLLDGKKAENAGEREDEKERPKRERERERESIVELDKPRRIAFEEVEGPN
ncbi:hypothetical protein RUM44_006160 [Polyplax serrata]|uniref:Uncharacterized protein n=1 Tax=Polyplax serrata TaxID=468196 RepID=A0ABR1B106_POLSC